MDLNDSESSRRVVLWIFLLRRWDLEGVRGEVVSAAWGHLCILYILHIYQLAQRAYGKKYIRNTAPTIPPTKNSWPFLPLTNESRHTQYILQCLRKGSLFFHNILSQFTQWLYWTLLFTVHWYLSFSFQASSYFSFNNVKFMNITP